MAAIRVQEVLIELRAEATQLFDVLRGVQQQFFQSIQQFKQFQQQFQQFQQQLQGGAAAIAQAQDQMTQLQQQVGGIAAQITQPVSALQFTLQQLNMSLAQLTFVMQRLGTLSAAFGVAMNVALGLALRSAIEFERGMRNVNSLLELSDERLRQLADSVLEVGQQTPQTLRDLIRALYEIASSGFDAQEGLIVLREGARAASAGLATVDQAVNAAITALRVYGLAAEDITRINDIMFKGVDIGRFTFADLAQQLGDFVGIGAQLGVEFEELIAAMAVLTVRGLNAAEASVSLASVLRELIKPSTELETTLRGLGFQSAQMAVQQFGLLGLLERLQTVVGNNQVAWARLFNEARAIRGLTLLMTDGFRGFRDALEEVRNSSGALARAFEEQSRSVGFQMELLRNNVQVMSIVALRTILPTVNAIVGTFSGLVNAITNAANAFPFLTSTIVTATVVLTGFSLTLGAFFATLAPIILLLQGQMIPALAALFSRVSALVTVVRTLLSLRFAGFMLGVAAALQIVDALAPRFLRVLGDMASSFAAFVASTVSGSKRVQDAWAEMQTRVASALISGALRGFGEFRGEAENILNRLSRIAAELPAATAERVRELVSELNKIGAQVDDLGRRMREAGLPESFVNVQVSRFRTIIDAQMRVAQSVSEEPVARIQRLVGEFQKLAVAVGSDLRVFTRGAVRDINEIIALMKEMPESLKQIREGVQQKTLSFEEARNRIREMQKTIQDVLAALDRMSVPEFEAAPFIMARQILSEINAEISKMSRELTRIVPVRLLSEVSVEDIRNIREEVQRLSEIQERAAQIAISATNLEVANRMQAARTLDQLILLEESRAKRILEIQQEANAERLRLIQDAQQRIESLLKSGVSELAALDADLARAGSAEEIRSLEERRRAVTDRLSLLNQDFERLEQERTRIVVEQNNLRARFLEEGARRIVEIFRTLDEEQRRLIMSQTEALFELARVQVEAATEVGVRVGGGFISALVDVIRTEGRRAIEAERDIERERLELRRSFIQLRLEMIRAASEQEIAELNAALARLESNTRAEIQIMDIRRAAFERISEAEIRAIRQRAEAEIAFLRQQRLPRRVIESREAEIRARAAEQEDAIRRQIEQRRIDDRERAIQLEIAAEQRRIELLRAQAESEIELVKQAAQIREEEIRLQFEARRVEIESELRLRETQTQQSIALSRIETQARIAQARFEFDTRMALFEAEIRARAAAGQITTQQANQMLAGLAQVKGQFAGFVRILEEIQRVREAQLLRSLDVERQRVGSILELLRRQLGVQLEINSVQEKARIDQIWSRFNIEAERSRSRIRVLQEEFEQIREPQFRIALGLRPIAQSVIEAGGEVVMAFDRFMGAVQESAERVAQVLNSLRFSVPEITVERARMAPPREPLEEAGVVVNVEGTRIELTPNEERLFAELMRKMLGPEGRRIFDQWASRGV